MKLKDTSKHVRVVLIGADIEMRRKLMKCFSDRGDQVFEAEGRADGMPLIYEIHPDLIYLEVIAGVEESWETFFRIRLFTDIPIVLLADQLPESSYRSLGGNNALVLLQPIDPSKAVAKGKGLCRLSAGTRTPVKASESAERVEPQPRVLKAFEVLAIDRALEEVGNRGEVRLIISQGKLRFMTKLKTQPFLPDSEAIRTREPDTATRNEESQDVRNEN